MTDSQTPTPPQANDTMNAQGDTRKTRRFATILAVVGLCVLALAGGLWFQRDSAAPLTPPTDVTWEDPALLAPTMKVEASEALPTMEFSTLDGQKITMAELKGYPILLNFWATWCPPCVKEMPELDTIAKEYADKGLIVIVASLDGSMAEARDYLLQKRLGSVRPVMDAGGKQFMRLKNGALPVTLLVKKDGTLAERLNGFHYWDAPPMRQKIRELVAE